MSGLARKTGSNGERTAAALRASALTLFAHRGYAAVSMREIAETQGMRPAALYNYWPTKQALLCDLMESHLRDLNGAWAAEAPGDDDPRAALEAFARFHLRRHIDRPHDVFIAYMELRSLEPENFARIEAARGAYESHLRAILDRGAATGAFHLRDTKIAAMAIIAMLTGVNTWYRPGGRLSPGEIEDIYLEMTARAVGAA